MIRAAAFPDVPSLRFVAARRGRGAAFPAGPPLRRGPEPAPAGSEEPTNGRSRNLRFLADKGDGGKGGALSPGKRGAEGEA